MVLRDLHPLPKTDKNGSATAARLAHWSRLASNVEESAREIHMRLVQNIILGVETFSERKKDRGSSCGMTLGSATLVTAIAECLKHRYGRTASPWLPADDFPSIPSHMAPSLAHDQRHRPATGNNERAGNGSQA